MLLSGATDVGAWLTQRLELPSRFLHPLVGTPGYSFPHTAGHRLVRVGDEQPNGISVGRWAEAPDNFILVDPEFRPDGQLYICFDEGVRNNVVVVGCNTRTAGDYHIHGSGNLVVLAPNDLQYSPLYVQIISDDQLLFWGQNSTTNGLNIQMLGDGAKVIVGDDCMFSSGIYLRNSDIHSIIDRETGVHKNPPTDILIEPHVWVGQDAYIGRKALVGFGSVVGTKSVVNCRIPRNCIAAGVPARVINMNATWDRMPTPQPETLPRLRRLERELCNPPNE